MRQPQKKLAHKKFDFDVFNTGLHEKNSCGTNGCMAGELPAVFPKHWIWVCNGVYRKNIKNNSSFFEEASEYFGIKVMEVFHLFYPDRQNVLIDLFFYTHSKLHREATKKQVVDNLERFLKIKNIL